MPVVEAHILAGYTPEEKARLGTALTEAVRAVVPAPDEAITVMLHEYPQQNYTRGGVARHPAPARPDPKATVTAYLSSMEARDLQSAQAVLAPGFEMHFPGAPVMHGLEELIAWARPRYRFVRKTIDRVESLQAGAVSVVFVIGTLAGEWPDGAAFSGIRFIDRFEIEDGLLTRQDVWNDLAEVRGK
jgi:4-oxalocrotonate tautomerase family enzyme